MVVRNLPLLEMIEFKIPLSDILILVRVLVKNELRKIDSSINDKMVICMTFMNKFAGSLAV